jgi:transcriptional regulator with XRE-family HTH domain
VVKEADLPKVFGQVVRRLRLEQGISQERLANLAGIDRAYMGALERGIRNPSLTMIARVAEGLGTSITDIVAAVEHPSRIRRRPSAGR